VIPLPLVKAHTGLSLTGTLMYFDFTASNSRPNIPKPGRQADRRKISYGQAVRAGNFIKMIAAIDARTRYILH
jgi:hypothetical protein